MLSSRLSALLDTPSIPSFLPLRLAIVRLRLNLYDKKHVVFIVYCLPLEASPKVFLFGISEIQDLSTFSVSLIYYLEERLKMLIKERYNIEVLAL